MRAIRLGVAIGAPLFIQLGWWSLSRWPLDPVAAYIAWSGDSALVLLLLSLAITPLTRYVRAPWLSSWRKPLGIAAGVYTMLHLGVYIGLDYAWDWQRIWQNVSTKRHLVVAVIAAGFILPLLVTSTVGWQRRLGKNWKALHTLVYPAALLAGLHYLWLVKTDIRLPAVALLVIVLLLSLRIGGRLKGKG